MESPQELNKFVLSFYEGKEKPRYVLIGVPEHSGSSGLAYFEGSAGGPAALRKASQLYCAFHRSENGKLKTFVSNSYAPIVEDTIPFADEGDRKKSEVEETISTFLQKGQFPITLGGDHSITYEVLKGVNKVSEKFAVVYFDAHPDFRSSDKAQRKSYATVMYDASHLSHIAFEHSIQVGVSDIEAEEFVTMKEAGVNAITALDIEGIGVQATIQKIKETIGNLPIYISVDLDVLDQSFAPAVATPSPCGLTSRELLFFLAELAKENVIGLDIMEHTPKDEDDPVTATVGARLILEFIVRHNSHKKNPSS